MTDHYQAVRTAFATMRRDGPRRHRDIAKILCISEAELLAAHSGSLSPNEEVSLTATRMNQQWAEQIGSLGSFGQVLALTRNAACVHEKIGIYPELGQSEGVGLVLGDAIDLRIFYKHWHIGFFVIEQTTRSTQHSLQYFDKTGTAIHKVFLRRESHLEAFYAFKERFALKDGPPDALTTLDIRPPCSLQPELPDADVDVYGLQQAWREMKDTHDAFLILRKFNVSRQQAFRLLGPAFAQSVRIGDCRRALSLASEKMIPIMVFVSNPGVIQIHTGIVSNISVANGWLNVLDEYFNLHMRQDLIATAWVVRKPTIDGVVTSLELFDHQGEVIAMLFGQRKPGIPENIQWRAMLDMLFEANRSCVA